MYDDRFGSYSIAATLAGTPSLRLRLKSILRYRRLAPPPRWREVLRPLALRPPDFLRPSTSVFSGSAFVISAKSGYVTKRRPGEVGLGLRIGMAYRSASRPWKIGIVSPARTCTTAFFHARVRPAVTPRRLGLEGTFDVRTSSTLTSSNRASTACLICVLCASGWTRNVYLLAVAST